MTILSLILVSALNWVFKWFTKWPRNQLVLVCKEPWILKMYCTNCVQSSLMSHTLWVTLPLNILWLFIYSLTAAQFVCIFYPQFITYLSFYSSKSFYSFYYVFYLYLTSHSQLSVHLSEYYLSIRLSVYPSQITTPSFLRPSVYQSPSVYPSQLSIHQSVDYLSILLHLLIHLNYLSICLKTIFRSVSICQSISTNYPFVWRLSFYPSPSVNPS